MESDETSGTPYRRIVLTITVYRSRSLARVAVHSALGSRGAGWWRRGWSLPLGSDDLEGGPLTAALYRLIDLAGEEFEPSEGTPHKI